MTYREIVERLQTIRDDIVRLNVRSQSREGLEPEDHQRWEDLNSEFHNLCTRKRELERQADMLAVEQADITARVGGEPRQVRTEGGSDRTRTGTNDIDRDILGEIDSIEDVRGGAMHNPWDTSSIRIGLTPRAQAAELRSRALSAVERMPGANDERRKTMTHILETFETRDARLSQLCLATSSPHYLRAFAKLAQTSGKSEVLNAEERAAVERAMSLTDAAGGYLVPFQIDPTVIITADGIESEVRQLARKVVATGDVWHGVSAGAVSWSFDAEAAEVSDDTPTFGQPTVTIRTARGFVPISLEAYQDESNVASTVGQLLAEGKNELEAQVLVDGVAGNNEPVGVITALVAAGGSIIVPSATSDTLGLGDIYGLHDALPARYRRRAAFLANALIYSDVRQFDTTGGSALWAQVGQARPQTLLGRPAYESEAMDGTVTATEDNYVAVFGDFSNYVVADRIGLQVEFIPHLFDATGGLPTGQRGWFAYYRMGANVINPAAFRLLNVT